MDNDGFIVMGSRDAGAPSCMDWAVNAALAVGTSGKHVAVRLETTWDASWGWCFGEGSQMLRVWVSRYDLAQKI
jgi:hypothetical protein